MAKTVSGRLPEGVRPDSYEIRIEILSEKRKFSGVVAIELRLLAPARAIRLHALELSVLRAVVESAGLTQTARVSVHPPTETVALAFPKTIPAGPARLTIQFSGRLNRQLRGLYEARVGRELYAFTQFEPTDARRMIPCFDEPALKARFRLTVTIPSDRTALSNMPAVEEKINGRTKTVRFDETPVMPTYLLALAVARLESKAIRVGPTRVAVWASPAELPLGEFALEVTAAVLPLLNDYFDLPYPYPKLDLVSVPDFAMGAMENWGAIFFRDSRLLLDGRLASTGTKRAVANVITHEIVHQWFGNLVTMVWWDDLWLNESFATWLACKIVDQWRPEWNSWVEFQQEKQIPLAIDALESTRPIQAPVESAAQIEEMFDALTYEKGAACLRMIEQFLGEATFRDGIRRYIKKHQFQNATAGDLWIELSEASGRPVAALARDWFTQGGFPLVTVRSAGPGHRSLTVSQERFHANRPAAPPDAALWTIPVRLKYADTEGVQTHPVLLNERAAAVKLPGPGAVDWVYANAGEAGYFRADYDPVLRSALQAVAARELDPAERIGFLNHLFALALRGTLPLAEFMETLLRFKGDRTRFVVEAMAGYLQTLSDQMVLPGDRARFSPLVRELIDPVWKSLGWEPRPDEDDEGRLTRAAAVFALGALAEDEEILSELPRLLTRYWADPATLDPTLVTPVLRLSAWTGGGALFDRYMEKFRSAATPENRDRYLLALADFDKPPLARKLLAFALSDGLRAQDVWKPVRYLLARPKTQIETWEFMKRHWSRLRKKGGSVGATRMIQGTRSIWRPEVRKEAAAFFNKPANRVAPAKRALAQTLEFMEIGIRFKELQQKSLSDWLATRRGPGA